MEYIGRTRAALRWPLRLAVAAAVLLASAFSTRAIITNLVLVRTLHAPEAEHLEQARLVTFVQNNQTDKAFDAAFEQGNALFERTFNALDGVGANVGQGQRFTRVPRADLTGATEWANHTPSRATGPNAQSCTSCHSNPADDGSGGAFANVHRDPQHSGALNRFIQRNTPHTFATGAVQRLAEEMTSELQSIRERASTACCLAGDVTRSLTTKGVSFGSIRVTRTATRPCAVAVDTSRVVGVAADLVVRPFQWKGSVAFIRDFNRGAAHNELGMQAVELVGDDIDGDFDGVANEMTVGDQTALAVYLAAQPRPTTNTELAALGLIDPLSSDDVQSIRRGRAAFSQVTCDVPSIAAQDRRPDLQ